jgi:hypothetical protein
MILGAFYLTNDGPALRAAYGEHASLSTRDQWQQILKAGGDAGELGTAMQMGFGLAAVLGSAGFSAIKALYRLAGPAGIAAVGGLAYAGYRRTGNTTKEKSAQVRCRSSCSSASCLPSTRTSRDVSNARRRLLRPGKNSPPSCQMRPYWPGPACTPLPASAAATARPGS